MLVHAVLAVHAAAGHRQPALLVAAGAPGNELHARHLPEEHLSPGLRGHHGHQHAAEAHRGARGQRRRAPGLRLLLVVGERTRPLDGHLQHGALQETAVGALEGQLLLQLSAPQLGGAQNCLPQQLRHEDRVALEVLPVAEELELQVFADGPVVQRALLFPPDLLGPRPVRAVGAEAARRPIEDPAHDVVLDPRLETRRLQEPRAVDADVEGLFGIAGVRGVRHLLLGGALRQQVGRAAGAGPRRLPGACLRVDVAALPAGPLHLHVSQLVQLHVRHLQQLRRRLAQRQPLLRQLLGVLPLRRRLRVQPLRPRRQQLRVRLHEHLSARTDDDHHGQLLPSLAVGPGHGAQHHQGGHPLKVDADGDRLRLVVLVADVGRGVHEAQRTVAATAQDGRRRRDGPSPLWSHRPERRR
mmetsp:Transcript_3909/g.11006  ORF Transcript_3909/g.11006 Transcript_3909/m.11006 type:complete len:413 (+) Transcript_3909:969-2207(+)